MSDASATGTEAITETTETETTETTATAELADLQAAMAELGLTPAQLKGRLEASRKNEQRAKANAKELDEFRRSTMSETEKAIDEARSIARAETLREVGGRLVDAEVRAAMAGRNVNVDALLEGLDRTAFLDDTGDVNRDALAAWAERIAPMIETKDELKGDPFLDLGQGTRIGDALKGDPLADLITSRLGL